MQPEEKSSCKSHEPLRKERGKAASALLPTEQHTAWWASHLQVTLCHPPKAFGHLLGAVALKWGPFLREVSGLHMGQLGTCLRAPGEELLPKAILHFHSQTPAQPRTAKAPLKASRTEERFG